MTPTSYDVPVARLRIAVAQNRSWRGVLRTLGLTAPRAGRLLRARCDAEGIGYAHFSSRSWTDAQLRAAAPAADWTALLAALGYAADSGSARATIRKHAVRLGLDLHHLEPAGGRREVADAFCAQPQLDHLRAAGSYLVAAACALAGHKVAWPLEPAPYDLLVDDGRLHRVQVKTTSRRVDGAWTCKLTRARSGHRDWYTTDEIDWFGIVDGELSVYLVPSAVVDGLGTIVVRAYDAYRVPRLAAS